MDYNWTTNKLHILRNPRWWCKIKIPQGHWLRIKGDRWNSKKIKGLQATQVSVLKIGLKDSSNCHSFKSKDPQVAKGGSREWEGLWISSSGKYIITQLHLWILLNFKRSWRKELRLREFKWKTLKRMKKKWKHFKQLKRKKRDHKEQTLHLCSLNKQIL